MAKYAMISTVFLVMVVMVMMEYLASPAYATFRECSVNISNVISVLGNDTLMVDCMKGSKHHHIFTPQILPDGEHYYGWKFVPDIWGLTYYECDFTWSTHFRRIGVWYDTNWLGTRDENTYRLCRHCVWHVAREGFWRMTGERGEKLPVFHGGWCNIGQFCTGF